MTLTVIFRRFKLFSTDMAKLNDSCYRGAMMTPAQCRAARGLIDWSQQQLAEAARVGVVTVRQFEGGAAEPRRVTMDALGRALESAGVEFIAENGGGPGVRLRKDRPWRPDASGMFTRPDVYSGSVARRARRV
jgi:transcriptional regulator with XRE-family HTH domain